MKIMITNGANGAANSIWVEVAAHLSARDVTRMASTCKRFKHIFKESNSSSLWEKLYLQMAQLSSFPSCIAEKGSYQRRIKLIIEANNSVDQSDRGGLQRVFAICGVFSPSKPRREHYFIQEPKSEDEDSSSDDEHLAAASSSSSSEISGTDSDSDGEPARKRRRIEQCPGAPGAKPRGKSRLPANAYGNLELSPVGAVKQRLHMPTPSP